MHLYERCGVLQHPGGEAGLVLINWLYCCPEKIKERLGQVVRMMEAREELLFFNGIACSGPALTCMAPLSSLAGRNEAGAWDSAGD